MMNSASRDSYPDEPGFVSQTAQGKTLSILCWKVLGLSESTLSCCRCHSVAS